MKVALFCHADCLLAVRMLRHFRQHGIDVALVVIETTTRRKFSATEQQFLRAHEEFTSSLARTCAPVQTRPGIVRTLWLHVPAGWRSAAKRLLAAARTAAVVKEAADLDIRVAKVEKHSSEVTRRLLEQEGITHVLLASSNWLIKEPLLSMPNTVILNAHCARLPRHRSLDSLAWSIVENDRIGLTAHIVDAGVDTGPILVFLEVPPEPGDTLDTLQIRVNAKKPEVLLRAIIGLRDGTITPRPQAPSDGIHHQPMTTAQLLEAEQLLQARVKGGEVAA